MPRTEYGIASLTDLTESTEHTSVTHRGLTAPLGCDWTVVDAYRLDGGGITLSSQYEQLCLPLGGDGRLTLDGSIAVPAPGAALVPAGHDGTLAGTGPEAWLVVGAPGNSSADPDPATVDMSACTFTAPETSDVPTARLTRRLGCTGMKVNARRLDPGQTVPYHVEGWQEELFVPLTGAGTMRIADRTHDLSRGSVARVGPETPRSAVNNGEDSLVWAMVGAPPTGGSDEWDPGAVILD